MARKDHNGFEFKRPGQKIKISSWCFDLALTSVEINLFLRLKIQYKLSSVSFWLETSHTGTICTQAQERSDELWLKLPRSSLATIYRALVKWGFIADA